MPNEKPSGSDDLLVQAIRRVHREQVEGKDESPRDIDDKDDKRTTERR